MWIGPGIEEAAGPGAGPAALWSRGRGVPSGPAGREERRRWKAVRVLLVAHGTPFGRNHRMPGQGGVAVSSVWRSCGAR